MLKSYYARFIETDPDGVSGPKSYGFGPGVHTSTTPLKLGGVLMPKKNKEAVSGSSFPQLDRAGAKESATSAPKKFRFQESDVMQYDSQKFNVVLIREGLGNLRDCFYYTGGALQKAAASKLFEGAQCFADHPSQVEEASRPERSTRDILGYFENINYQTLDGGGALVGTLNVSKNISSDWALALLTNSLEYAKKFKESDLVGLSINASGDAQSVPLVDFMKSNLPTSVISKLLTAQSQGVTEVRVVSELSEAISCDLVTKAGAGGRILALLGKENYEAKA